MMRLSVRATNLAIFAACAGLLATALLLQEVLDLKPCYLCIVQRVFVMLVGLTALLAWLHQPGAVGQRLYAAGITLGALGGGGFAIRHLWLQSLPADRVPACGPPADYLLQAFPLVKALPMLLAGDGNCAAVDWTLFHISIPGWTLVAFTGLAVAGLWQFKRAA